MTIVSTKWHFQARKYFIFPINQSTSHLWDIPLNNQSTHIGIISILKVKSLYHICGRSLSTLHWGTPIAIKPPWLRASIPKLHPYQQHINTQDASIWQQINIQNASILATHQYLNCIHIGINTQTALILATHQYPKYIHIVITSIPKMHPYWHHINTQWRGNLGLHLCIIGDPNATCSISFNPTPSCAELLLKEKEINIVHLHLKESC